MAYLSPFFENTDHLYFIPVQGTLSGFKEWLIVMVVIHNVILQDQNSHFMRSRGLVWLWLLKQFLNCFCLSVYASHVIVCAISPVQERFIWVSGKTKLNIQLKIFAFVFELGVALAMILKSCNAILLEFAFSYS